MDAVDPLTQATGILGEHFKNYVVIVQDADNPSFFDLVNSDPYATTGLLIEAQKWHHAQMNAVGDDEFDWEENEDNCEDAWEDDEDDS